MWRVEDGTASDGGRTSSGQAGQAFGGCEASSGNCSRWDWSQRTQLMVDSRIVSVVVRTNREDVGSRNLELC